MSDVAKRVQEAILLILNNRVKELQKAGRTHSARQSKSTTHRLTECKYLITRLADDESYKAIAAIIESELTKESQ